MKEQRVQLKHKAIHDDALENVTGGYRESASHLTNFGYDVNCPFCGESSESNLRYSYDPDDVNAGTEYHCNTCGGDFRVEVENGVAWSYFSTN